MGRFIYPICSLNKVPYGLCKFSVPIKWWLLHKTATHYVPSELISGISVDLIDSGYYAPIEFNILGNSIQDGTPSPDSPVPINSVGDNENLLGLIDGSYTTITGISCEVSNGEITINGTATANSFLNIDANVPSWVQGQKYAISINNAVANSGVAFRINSDGGLDTVLDVVDKNVVKTYNGEADIFTNRIVIRVANTISLTNFKLKPKIDLGEEATPYSPYNMGSIAIEKCNKNLFDYSKNIIDKAVFDNSRMRLATDNNCKLSFIPCAPNTKYTISRTTPQATRFAVGTMASIPNAIPTSDNSLLQFIYANTSDSITITTDENAKYLLVRFIYNEIDDYETYAKTIQIELRLNSYNLCTTPKHNLPYIYTSTNESNWRCKR